MTNEEILEQIKKQIRLGDEFAQIAADNGVFITLTSINTCVVRFKDGTLESLVL